MSQEEFVPPINFGMVSPGIYRSGFPSKKNFAFLKRIGIKTIVYLCPETYIQKNMEFSNENNITIKQFGIEGNKEPFIHVPIEAIQKAVSELLDTRNHPILIHCNKGLHRTGVTVGCLRRTFAGRKERMLDQQFIELFPVKGVLVNEEYKPKWL